MYSMNIANTSSRTPAWPYAWHPWKFAAAAHVTGSSTVVLGKTTIVDTGSCNPELRCGPQAGLTSALRATHQRECWFARLPHEQLDVFQYMACTYCDQFFWSVEVAAAGLHHGKHSTGVSSSALKLFTSGRNGCCAEQKTTGKTLHTTFTMTLEQASYMTIAAM